MDYEKFLGEYEKYDMWNKENDYPDNVFSFRKAIEKDVEDDRVENPSHYTKGTQEAIVTIEEAVADAPSVPAGFLHGQVLKYLLRVWLKDNPLEDLKKARWYLNRLIDSL
jgi:hypothetical protein